MNSETIRPTKKQQILLVFIDEFINEHGYSPSYREIMKALDYTSPASVALHINSLIKRGHLAKRDRSARSLEVVSAVVTPKVKTNKITEAQEKWLVEKVDHMFDEYSSSASVSDGELDKLYVMVGALKVLGLEGAASSFMPRLGELKKKTTIQ